MTALIGYLQHPDPSIRKATMGFVGPDESARVSQALFDRLTSDPDATVQVAAAQTIWVSEREANCKYAIWKLKDTRDQSRVRKGLSLLIDHAPDAHARKAVQKLFSTDAED